jgi:hypothetical protein
MMKIAEYHAMVANELAQAKRPMKLDSGGSNQLTRQDYTIGFVVVR